MAVFISKHPEFSHNTNTLHFIESFDRWKKEFTKNARRNDLI